MRVTEDKLQYCNFVEFGEPVYGADVIGELMMLLSEGRTPEKQADIFRAVVQDAKDGYQYAIDYLADLKKVRKTRFVIDKDGAICREPISESWRNPIPKFSNFVL